MKNFSFVATIAVALAFGLAMSADAQITTNIVNDSFSDGITDLGPNQIGFNTTSSGSALDLGQAAGPLDFATGDSGRTIHGLFAAQTLSLFGDKLEVSFNFTTPETIAYDGGTNGVTGSGSVSTNEDFKFGLFSTAGSALDFTQSISTSSGSPNTGLNGLAGFFGEIDNINAGGTDLGIRTHNVNSTADAAAPSGQFLNSNTGFDFISGGTDDVISLASNTDYIGSIIVEFTDATLTTFDITVGIADAGGAFTDAHTDTVSIADLVGTEVGVNTTTFDLLGFHATSGAFGGTVGPTAGSSSTGEANNGIDISNITVDFTTTAIPEPSSLGLILLTGMGLCFRRRR